MKEDLNKPLTKEQLKKLQQNQKKSSPYDPGKSPFKKASNIFHPETTVPGGSVNDNTA